MMQLAVSIVCLTNIPNVVHDVKLRALLGTAGVLISLKVNTDVRTDLAHLTPKSFTRHVQQVPYVDAIAASVVHRRVIRIVSLRIVSSLPVSVLVGVIIVKSYFVTEKNSR